MKQLTNWLCVAAVWLLATSATAQMPWQQRAEYTMDVNMDVKTHQYTGRQVLVYTNNSPDALNKLYYHLYFNAFQPGSSMDLRSRTIEDPDPRVGGRIAQLAPADQGFLHVEKIKVNGKEVKAIENETILEIALDKAIAPGAKATIELDFRGQVPLQIRRSGRMSAEGIDYSMSQWYPKLCEYDADGWHPNPYIGREFYGVWGDFVVNITIDKSFVVAATGVLQNPAEIGYGYIDESKVKRANTEKLTWKFKAQNVHDFVWAADPEYMHTTAQVPDGPMLHFFFKNDPAYAENWKNASELVVKGFQFLSTHFGKYPYPVYSIIQGGDGGMEYPMATLITGNRKLPSLVGVTIHEAAHSWYQGLLATNESLYPWMDEGFTSYASTETMAHLFVGRMPGDHSDAYSGYISIVNEGKEEALDTHADHYITNYAYGNASYNKGEVYLAQLAYVIGQENLDQTLLNYFDKWKFRHPNAMQFLHEAELTSGLVLDWYHEYFVETTKTIDYAISEVRSADNKTAVSLKRKGLMPMPVDFEVTYKDGSTETFYIPLDLMRGEKPKGNYSGKWTVLSDWNWVNDSYTVIIPKASTDIVSLNIDPSERMADVARENNFVTLSGETLIIDNK